MAVFTLDLGRPVDMLTKSELEEALAADAQLRAVVAGVKTVETLFNINQIGASQFLFTTPPGMVAPGYIWSVMNIGLELAASSQVRVYKGIPALSGSPAITPTGTGRVVDTMTSFVTPSSQFSKGQLILRGGDQLTFVSTTPASAFILSVFMVSIEIPAERIGELLI